MTLRRRSLRSFSTRTRTANGSQSRDSGFLYTSGPDAVVFGGRGTRDCATTDTIASTHLGESDHKLADLAALRRESDALDALCACGTGGHSRVLEAVAPMQESGRTIDDSVRLASQLALFRWLDCRLSLPVLLQARVLKQKRRLTKPRENSK